MSALRYAGRLPWRNLDPRTHPFDDAGLSDVVRRVLWPARPPRPPRLGATGRSDADREHRGPDELGRLEAAVQLALVARWGAWIGGFCWSENGDGGPVHSWCCAGHSVDVASAAGVEATTGRVVSAVHEWRAFLNEAADRFDRLDTDAGSIDVASATERAAAALLPWIIEVTQTTETWHATFASVIAWYLERHGHDAPRVWPEVQRVVRGEFESWCAPSSTSAAVVCAALGQLATDASIHDMLPTWIRIRRATFTTTPLSPDLREVAEDGHLAYVAMRDARRSPERAEHMRRAIEAARASADRGEPLTLEGLTEWTSLALGRGAVLRTTDAYAKGGRERYGYRTDLIASVRAALSDTTRRRDGPLVRAARVYLDVCFFHPFEDGNARAARLALDHVLSACGLALHAAEPLFAIARSADDPSGGHWFVSILDALVGRRSD